MPLVEGLGSRALYQGFASHEEALTDYLEARAKSWVRVIRLPGDSDVVFGDPDAAEDL